MYTVFSLPTTSMQLFRIWIVVFRQLSDFDLNLISYFQQLSDFQRQAWGLYSSRVCACLYAVTSQDYHHKKLQGNAEWNESSSVSAEVQWSFEWGDCIYRFSRSFKSRREGILGCPSLFYKDFMLNCNSRFWKDFSWDVVKTSSLGIEVKFICSSLFLVEYCYYLLY